MISEIHVRKIKEVETGGRPTPIEQPIKLRMTKNNIGFKFAGVNILHCNKSDINDILNIF